MAVGGRIVRVHRALVVGTCPPGNPPIEDAVNAQLSSATLAQMMDCSSQLALCIGDQLESVTKAEQDCQQRSHLHPVQQQASRFETHLTLSGSRLFAKESGSSGFELNAVETVPRLASIRRLLRVGFFRESRNAAGPLC